MSNNCLLKVGVAPFEDGKKLTKDYGCRVFGTLDLRKYADYMGIPNEPGLASLCMKYLGIEMNKFFKIRCSDWNADVLTDKQISYAAFDAIASVQIYHEVSFYIICYYIMKSTSHLLYLLYSLLHIFYFQYRCKSKLSKNMEYYSISIKTSLIL